MVQSVEERKAKQVKANKIWYENNKARILERQRAYKQTAAGKKSQLLATWKQRGLIDDNYDELYDSYLQVTHCAFCKNEFKNTNDRCLDHNHETGLFRAFLCNSCNLCDVLKPSLTA
jgi:hypothetical protein